MKTIFNFSLGLIILMLVTTSTFASKISADAPLNKNSRVKSVKAKRTDYLYYLFAYQATSQGSGNYHVVITFILVNQNTGQYGPVNSANDVAVTVPGIGNFTFPSGHSTLDLGTINFGSTTPGNNIPITTVATTQNTHDIAQTLMYYANLINL